MHFQLSATVTITTTVLGISVTIKDVSLDKSMSLPSADGLSNTTIDSFQVEEDENGDVIVVVTATAFNPSIANILPMGALTLDLYYEDTFIATSQTEVLNVYIGSNTFAMSGVLPQSVETNPAVWSLS